MDLLSYGIELKDTETRSTLLASHFNLTKKKSPKVDDGKKDMAKVTYAFAVGSLMYAKVCTKPDITHAVGVVSKFMSNPGRKHCEAVTWLLRYLKGTSKVALCFISWMSRLQKSVSLSTTEAEYMAIYEASNEMIWLKNFLEELGRKQANSALSCNSLSDIHLTKNLMFHTRTKHIQLRYHFTRELISSGTLSLKKILG
ncbi:hypothetical protein AgCh_030926 [Apium graveolens]